MRESNPLRGALQAPALPFELTDLAEEGRGLEPHAVVRANRVPDDLRTSRICLPDAVRTAGFEPAISSPPD